MMENNDEQLIARFFQETKIDIEDEGFSQSVMSRLPDRSLNLSRLWTVLCSIAGAVFFLLIDGIDSLRMALNNVLGDMIGSWSSFNITGITPLMVIIAVITLLLVTLNNLMSTK